MSVKLLTEHHFEFLSLKRRLHRLVFVYTCQNATLLEISCVAAHFSMFPGVFMPVMNSDDNEFENSQ